MMKNASTQRASWRDWFGLGAMALALFMLSTDHTMLFLAQPSIGAELRPTAVQGLWIVNIGAFLGAALVMTMGRLGDRVGRKRLVIIGTAGYGAASLFAAFAPTAEALIGARALLGAATAAVTPSAMALLRTMFPDSGQFTRAFSMVMAAFSAGVAFGPPLGGLLIEYFWWGAVFLVNVPAALIFLAVAPWALPEFRDDQPVRLDPPSIALSVVSIMGIIYGIQQAAEGTVEAQHIVITFIGLSAGYLFLRRQGRIDDPLLDLTLLKAPQVRVTLIALFFVMVADVGPDVLVGPFLQVGLDLTALQAGMILFIPAAASIPATMLAPPLKRRLGVRGGTVLSLSLTATGFAIAALALLGGQGPATLVLLTTGLTMVAWPGSPQPFSASSSSPVHPSNEPAP